MCPGFPSTLTRGAVALVVGTVLSACGSGGRTIVVPGSATPGTACEEAGGCPVASPAPTTTAAADLSKFEGCAESGGCTLSILKNPDGTVFVCTALSVVSVTVHAATTAPSATAVAPASSEAATPTPASTQYSTAEPQHVLRPRCAEGAAALPAKGLNLDDFEGVTTSQDGKSAWTQSAVPVHGQVKDGTFVAGG
jgi:hypothetical protein